MNTRDGRRIFRDSTSNSKSIRGEGPNWIFIAGGALLTTLSIRLGYKLKRALDTKQQHNASTRSKGAESIGGNHPPNGHIPPSSEVALPLATVPTAEFNKDNGFTWPSSPDRLELLPKPFHHSNCSDSPCVSESGSDVYSKREVIQKLRHQLKRRDDMIMEMQDQIKELQNSLDAQTAHSSHLQSQVDAANRDLFDSEREIQRLRKAIADHCVTFVNTNEKTSTVTALPSDIRNGHHGNGYLDIETYLDSTEKGRGDRERIEMLRRVVGELKEVIEGKQYLLQSYKVIDRERIE